MQITSVAQILTPAGLASPPLRALIPSIENYSVLLMQPQGQIEASTAGVRHQDSEDAKKQFRGFINDAREKHVDLAVTPEYSMPWATLVEVLQAGHTPAAGTLWAFGCESIKYSELVALEQALAPHVVILFEPLEPDPRRFVDPLCYVFLAPPANGNAHDRVVLLVQFKTCPMADDNHFEINGLQRGTLVYEFGGARNQLRLVSLICSDALEFFDPQAAAIYDRALILHIQLNPKPRQDQFRQYRTKLLGFTGDATEIICLNWAKDVNITCDNHAHCWRNISGSAWYLRPDKFDDQDSTLSSNHKQGLYYTWLLSLRAHALFFNYHAASYFLTATKVAHIGVATTHSRRRGPQLTSTRVWDSDASSWKDRANVEDGFSSVVGECGAAQQEIKRLADGNPFHAERVLVVSA